MVIIRSYTLVVFGKWIVMFGTIPKWKTVDYIKIQHKNDIKINVKETNLLGHDVNEYA